MTVRSNLNLTSTYRTSTVASDQPREKKSNPRPDGHRLGELEIATLALAVFSSSSRRAAGPGLRRRKKERQIEPILHGASISN